MQSFLKSLWRENLSILWQLPQLLVSFVVLLRLRQINELRDVVEYKDKFCAINTADCLFSLGEVFFVPEKWDVPKFREHEYTHSLQSEKFGPLYLFVFPLTWLAFGLDLIFHRKWEKIRRRRWYYNLPWERGPYRASRSLNLIREQRG